MQDAAEWGLAGLGVHIEMLLKNMVSLRESLLHIPDLPLDVVDDVVRRIVSVFHIRLIMNDRRVFFGRLVLIKYCRQHLVAHVNMFERFLGYLR